MPVFENRKNDYMDCALKNLENMSLDDAKFIQQQQQQQQTQVKSNYTANETNNQNQMAYEEYIKNLEYNLSRTRNQRIKQTLFPEIFEDDDINYAQVTNCEPTSVQKLADCAKMLKHAVVNLVNYQDDADLATKAIPELINLLNEDRDPAVVQNAMMLLYQLSKKEASRHAIMSRNQIITSVIRTIAEHEQNHELVRLNGGLQKMVSLLARNNYKLLTYVTDCLHLMIYGNQESKLIILASGGPQELVRIMKTYTYEKLLWTTSRVLMVLSVCNSNKPSIIAAGGLSALAVHLKNSSEQLVQSCLYALRNLSDDTSILNENLEQLITSLVDLINSEKPNVVLCVTGILSNITCNNQHAKALLCQCNSIPSLINVLIKFPDRDDILEPTICVLRHLSIRQAEEEFASNAIRINNGIPILVKLLNTTTRWHLIKVIVGLLRNLAFNVQNHQQFREQQVIPKLINLLIKAQNEVKRHKTNETNTLNANGTLIGANLSTQPVYIDGVSMDLIIECIVGALQLLSKQLANREIIRLNNDLIPILVELLYNESEAVQRVAVGTLCELANEKEGANKIEIEGSHVPLSNLLNSRNESISAYSAAVLYKMSDGKSLDYKKQLTSELTSSLYHRDDLNNASNWQMTLNSTANDLDINNLLYPQFATLNNSLTQTNLNPVSSTLYQDVYNTQASFNTLPNGFQLDSSLNTNDFGTYGQIGTLQQIQTQPQANLTNPWATYDTDL